MPTAKRRRVLIVEDDPDLVSAYRRFFEEQHAGEFSASYAADGEQALGVLRDEPVDVLILDWTLPGISGANLTKALRAHARTRALGILMVTAKSAVAETVFALESGADDYLTKPFEWSVLLARLRSLARRSELTFESRLTKTFPGLELDVDADLLKIDGRVVRLTPKEMDLLKVFLSRPGVLHALASLWQAVWGYEAEGWERTLIVTLSSLRRKLGPSWGARLMSHPSRGYCLELDL